MTVREMFEEVKVIVCRSPQEEHAFYVAAYDEHIEAESSIDSDFIDRILDYDPAEGLIDLELEVGYPIGYSFDGDVFCAEN